MFRRVILTALCISLATGLTVQALQESANEKDKKALQGKWDIVSVASAGKEQKPKGAFVSFDGGKLTFTPKLVDFSEFSFNLDASKTPKTLDLKSEGDASFGIYELKGDDLKLCLDGREPVSKNRPKEFVASEHTILMVLRRVKK